MRREPGDEAAGMTDAPLRVTFLGTRGSVSTPEPSHARHGGNTACVQIQLPGDRLILLDAGTGIRHAAATRSADLFLTHYHWDHISGLPFFPALHDPAARICIRGPSQTGARVEDLLGDRITPIYCPVPWHAFAARVSVEASTPRTRLANDVEVCALPVSHPSATVAYRVRCGESRVAYVPDNDLGADRACYDRLTRFVRGADLLIHDAMLTRSEYEQRRDWGHSTAEQALRLALDAGVQRLRLFHHHPQRTDAELDVILGRLGGQAGSHGLELDMARERDTVTLPVPRC
jgi:ribonuclease BN (tRNA processing enzyme)